MSPAAATIICTPYAKTFAHITPQRIFAFANIQNSWIAGCYRNAANAAAKIFISNIFPVAATINGFPNTTTGSAKIKCIFLVKIANRRAASASTVRANGTVFYFT